MDEDIFEEIKAGLEDAAAYAKGDKTQGRVTAVIGNNPGAVQNVLQDEFAGAKTE